MGQCKVKAQGKIMGGVVSIRGMYSVCMGWLNPKWKWGG